MPKAKTYYYRGKAYPSRKDLAYAIGVSPSSITRADRKGALDKLEPRDYAPPIPVNIAGVTYKSISEAARKLNIPYRTLYYYVDKGDPEGALIHIQR